jgi:hypothetical protein
MSVMFALFVAASLPSQAADKPAAKNGSTMTAKESQELVATAKTPQDHLRLAQYFNHQAAGYEAEATNHDAMVVAYRKNAVAFSRNTLEGTRAIGHCEFLAKSNRDMAVAVREMAASHEAMAKESAR